MTARDGSTRHLRPALSFRKKRTAPDLFVRDLHDDALLGATLTSPTGTRATAGQTGVPHPGVGLLAATRPVPRATRQAAP